MTEPERDAVHLAIVALVGIAYAEHPYGTCARHGLLALCLVGFDTEIRTALDEAEASMPPQLRVVKAGLRAGWPLELQRAAAEGT